MKKVSVLSLFAMATFVSQAWAEECKVNGQQLWCQIGSGCYRYTTEYSGVGDSPSSYVCKPSDPTEGAKFPSNLPICTCAQLLEGCQGVGQAYTGVNESVNSAPNWGAGADCAANGGTKYGAGAEKCDFCQYPGDGGCHQIWAGGEYSSGANCTEAKAKCTDDYGTVVTSCGSSPILKFTPASLALTVAQSGRSLHISSAKEATVSLYDMSGAKVYSGKVRAGSSVFSLEKVAVGSYYAVVQSGSDAKKVSVVLK